MKYMYTEEPAEGCHEFDGVYGRPAHNDEIKSLKSKGWKENIYELRNQEKRQEKEDQGQVGEIDPDLVAQYTEVIGKAPHHKMKPETMKAKIDEALSDD